MSTLKNHKFYTATLEKHGDSAQGVAWISKKTQNIRFEILTSFIVDEIQTSSIADVGCGLAHYYKYLKKASLKPKKYIGIDVEKAMLEKIKFKNEITLLNLDATKDTLPICDYYICSGALNILERFETFLFISNCFKASKKGFIFNFLDDNVKSDTYNYLSMKMLKPLLNKLNADVIVKSSYLDNDKTIFLIKK